MLKVLKTFYSFFAKRKLTFAIFILLIIIASVLDSILPYFYKLFVDAIPKSQYQDLIKILLLYTGVSTLNLFVGAIHSVVGDKIAISSSSDARTTIFNHLQKLDLAFHVNKSTGSLISIFKRGDGAFFDFQYNIHRRILAIIVSFLTMLYFFTLIDPWITVVTITSTIIIFIVGKFVITVNISARKKFLDEEDNISAIIVDNMINFETVKLFSKENWELNRLKKAFIEWRKRLTQFFLSFRLFDLTVGNLINVSIFLSLLLALKFIFDKKITLGDFVLVIAFINAFYPKIMDLMWGFREITKTYIDIHKYFNILDYEVEVKDPEKPVRPRVVSGEINFDNVNFSYKGGQKNALHNFDLKIKSGESIAFVGKSGSGKTTAIKLLMRFYDPEKGKISIDGIDIRKMNKSYLRSLMGVVPQEPILFDNTISYNIAYGDQSVGMKEIKAAAKMANIDKFIESLPLKYEAKVGERGIKLSGGQKQRLAIARMILSNPKIIIFDEATSQLDSESEALIQDALWKNIRNRTTIIIAHRLSTVMKADRIIVMEKGRIVEEGSHKELLTIKNGLYSHFWSLQVNF